MQQNNENTNAFLIHISAFAGYLFPLGSIITPLILWQTLKDKSPFLDEHGKEAINFNISFSLYIFLLSASFFSFLFRHFLDIYNGINIDLENYFPYNGVFSFISITSVVSIVSLIKIALIIIASMKANKGEKYKYPLTINFIK